MGTVTVLFATEKRLSSGCMPRLSGVYQVPGRPETDPLRGCVIVPEFRFFYNLKGILWSEYQTLVLWGGHLRNRLETVIAEMLEMGIRLPLAKKDFEKAYLRLALEKNEGHRLATARSLGIHRNTLKNKLVKHRLAATSRNGKGRIRQGGKAEPRGRKI